jgi:hypothetical protein
MNLHSITVSACRGAFDRNTYEVNLLDWLENVRPEHPRNDWEKKQLPAIMPHGLFATRRQDSFTKHSGLVQIDIDAKHQASDWTLEETLDRMSKSDSIVAYGVSSGGCGAYALYAVDNIDDAKHSDLAEDVISIASGELKSVIDEPVSNNLSSLRFASPYMPVINFDCAPIEVYSNGKKV